MYEQVPVSHQDVNVSVVNGLLAITIERLTSLDLQSGDAQLIPNPERCQTCGAEILSTHGKPTGPPPRTFSTCCESQFGYSPHCHSLREDRGTHGQVHSPEMLALVWQPSTLQRQRSSASTESQTPSNFYHKPANPADASKVLCTSQPRHLLGQTASSYVLMLTTAVRVHAQLEAADGKYRVISAMCAPSPHGNSFPHH